VTLDYDQMRGMDNDEFRLFWTARHASAPSTTA